MNNDIILNELMKIIKDDIILYKNINKSQVNNDSVNEIFSSINKNIKKFIDNLNEMDTDFRCIGIYRLNNRNYDLSSYYINKNGLIITDKYIIKDHNNVYSLKLKNGNYLYFSKKKLIEYIFTG